jgi:hypothetical protein
MNLQDVIDELAEALGRTVVIEGASRGVLASSATTASRRPAVAPVDVCPDCAFPIQDPRGRLGVLRLAHGRSARSAHLTPAQYSLVDGAVDAVRRILGSSSRAGGGARRADVLAGLRSTDGESRRSCFAEAVDRRWLRRDSRTVVRAVRLGSSAGPLQRRTLARRIDASPSSGLMFVGEQGGALVFVSVEAPDLSPTDESDALLRAEARKSGLTVHAIGSARHDRRDDDLRATAERAALASTIVGSLPNGRGRGDIADLGAWVLLASVSADSSQLATLSPAAAALLERGDETQRRTVEAYLDVRGSVREACELLHIHRTTLYYRLENLPDAVRDALDDGLARSTLHLCLKLMRFRDGLEGRRAS